MVLADTENEYQSLCDPRFLPNGILAGRVGQCSVTVENAAQFGRYVLEQRLQVVLNLHSYELDEAAEIMVNLIAGLRGWKRNEPTSSAFPCEFLLKEATTWLPQNVNREPIAWHGNLQQAAGAFLQ